MLAWRIPAAGRKIGNLEKIGKLSKAQKTILDGGTAVLGKLTDIGIDQTKAKDNSSSSVSKFEPLIPKPLTIPAPFALPAESQKASPVIKRGDKD